MGIKTTKDRLIVCAATLFAEDGCKAITMDDIASSAGMSKRTIYEHFTDKANLLEACLHYFLSQHELDIRNVLQSSENIIAAIFKMLENTSKLFFQLRFNFLHEVQKYYPEIYFNTVKVYKQQFLDHTEKMLQKGIHDGIIREDINPAILTILISEVSILILHKDVFADYGYDKKIAMHTFMGCITQGILTEKGILQLNEHLIEFDRTKLPFGRFSNRNSSI
ncbi:MAG: TetR/AcrR family transcriptional regulator [Tannerella sp.]|nr:TetR/AcrR family transcriptional regulator [Tannerella sp.]